MTGIFLFPLRFLVFIVGFIAYWMEIGADWIIGARSRTEYAREGACKKCGRCCCLLALVMPEGVSRHDWLVRIVGFWHRIAMNFRPVGEEKRWLVYRCGYYREGDGKVPGKCSIYPFRHRICRFFPRQKLYGYLSLHEDCGYSFVRRNVMMKRKFLKGEGRPIFDEVLTDKLNIKNENAK